MGIQVNSMGQVWETITLPVDGKVIGRLNVVWLSRGRATVGGTVTFRTESLHVSTARFEQEGDVWVFVPENMMSPVRRPGGLFEKPAPPTFRDAVLAEVSEALTRAWSVDTARAVGREDTARQIRELEDEERDLCERLAVRRAKLASLRREHARFSD